MSEMVERVAQAIGIIMWSENFDGTDARQREKFAEAARAAIEAMREPPDDIQFEGAKIGGPECGLRDAADIWNVMIDAALR